MSARWQPPAYLPGQIKAPYVTRLYCLDCGQVTYEGYDDEGPWDGEGSYPRCGRCGDSYRCDDCGGDVDRAGVCWSALDGSTGRSERD